MWIFIPHRQKITINTGDSTAAIYIDRVAIAKGKTYTNKIAKKGAKQVIIRVEGRRDAYHMLLPKRRVHAFWPIVFIDLFGWYLYRGEEVNAPKIFIYDKVNHFGPGEIEISKSQNEKFLNIGTIDFGIKDKTKDVVKYDNIRYSENLIAKLDKRENKLDSIYELENNDIFLSDRKELVIDDKVIELVDVRIFDDVSKILKKGGYIDTINKVFLDRFNTLNLDAKITKFKVFEIGTPGSNQLKFLKAKLYITWYLKNAFGEQIDSIESRQYSSNFSKLESIEEKMLLNAFDESFHQLFQVPKFQEYLKLDTNFVIKDQVLRIPSPTSVVSDVSEASNATVTIKRKDGGHGSGFAISNNGYILTNYHVLAGKTINTQAPISVILSDGVEVPVRVVRFNRNRDIALLKVEREFVKAFKLESENSFRRMMEVYTIGTPNSIELGQSVSLGLISNERKSNNNHLLQLKISINLGNSGGPLFEKNGRLHGVVSSKLVGFSTEGIGFAIPSYMIPEYLNLEIK